MIGYKELECEGDSKELESKSFLQAGDEIYCSRHPVNEPKSCSNPAMGEVVVYGQKISNVLLTPLIAHSVLMSIDFREWSQRRWNNAISDTQKCWRKKASEAGVQYHKKKFKMEVNWNLESQGLTTFK